MGVWAHGYGFWSCQCTFTEGSDVICGKPFFLKCSAQNQMCFMSHTVYLVHLDVNAPHKEKNEYHFMGDLAAILQKIIFCGMTLRDSKQF